LLKRTCILIVLSLFIFTCSSEPEFSVNDNSEMKILEISPNNGFVGDDIIIKWSGINEPITSAIVEFNGLNATVTNIGSNQLTCLVPENATTGKILLKINEYQKISIQDFIIEEEAPLSFSVSNHSPDLIRPGYKMTLYGDGFGSIMENVSVLFKNSNGVNIESKILNLSNNSIELAVPVKADENNIEIIIEGESLIYPINIENILHKPIYYFFAHRIRALEINNEGVVSSTDISDSFSGVSEIYSFDYSQIDNTFYGQNHVANSSTSKTKFIRYNENTGYEYVDQICNCINDHSTVTNTLTNKKYFVSLANISFDNIELTFKEVNSNGETINVHTPISFTEYINPFVFAPEINSFVSINDLYSEFKVYKVDATTFSLTTSNIGSGVVESLSDIGPTMGLIFDQQNDRAFFPRSDDVYEIDLVTNNVTKLNTDWFEFFNTNYGVDENDRWNYPGNFVYYEPTNEIIIQPYSFFDQISRHKFFAINLASKQTRELSNHFALNYSGNSASSRVYKWVMKN